MLCIPFLLQLLRKDSRTRLGSGPGSCEEVKSHPFFRHTDWDKVYKKQVEPPFKPNLSDPTDVSLFDSRFTNQNPVESPDDGSLTPSKRDVFEGFTYVAPSVMDSVFREPWSLQSETRIRRRSGSSMAR